MFSAFLHGYLLSFGLILPLGPQNVFVFSQGATQPKWRRALPVVVTASFADTLLILVAVLGVSAMVLTVPWVKIVLGVIGVCFLLTIGWWRGDRKCTNDATAATAHSKADYFRTIGVAAESTRFWTNQRDRHGRTAMRAQNGSPSRQRHPQLMGVVLHAGRGGKLISVRGSGRCNGGSIACPP
jgi:hypothetical protein